MPKEKEIIYKDSYIAFLDVLGFKKLVMKDCIENMDKLNEYFDVLEAVILYIRAIESKKDIGFTVISDSIIMSIPKTGNLKEQKKSLRNLCIAVGMIQQNLANRNIWLRGGISFGKAYHDISKNQIVGPAYISAYLLEESVAKYPRVVLDSKIIGELEYRSASEMIEDMNMSEGGGLNYRNWGSSVLFNWSQPDGKPITHITQDVPLFIDYLCPMIEGVNSGLKRVILNIEENIYSDTSLYSKYRWVVDYLKALKLCAIKNDKTIDPELSYRLDNL